MAPVLADQYFRELGGIGEVAVVAETDAVRRVDVERLRLRGTVAPGGGVAHVTDAHVTFELEHVVLLEHVAHQAAALAHTQLPFARGGRNAGRILAAMLQHGEGVIETLIDGAGTNDTDDAAHGRSTSRAGHYTRTCCSEALRRTRSSPTRVRRPLAIDSP